MNKAEVVQSLSKAGLDRIKGDLEPLMKPAIGIKANPTEENSLAVGASKLGGLPDLSAGVAWPMWKDLPMSFIAQFRLADLRPYDVEKALPPRGMLYFFYDAKQETYGHTGAERGGWKVIYQADPVPQLQRTAAPQNLPPEARFGARSAAFSSKITLPQWQKVFLKNANWKPEEEETYSQFMADFPAGDDAPYRNHLLGHPDELQDDMHLEVHMAAHGVDPKSQWAAQSMAEPALGWRLLFQVDSDERVGMKWAGTGRLYYWIEDQALKQPHFDNVWLILQSD
jgi:uncharacterized protein YwqG